MNNSIIKILFGIIFFIVLLSCDKDDDDLQDSPDKNKTTIETAAEIIEEDLIVDNILNDITDNVDNEISILENQLKLKKILEANNTPRTGAVVTIDSLSSDPKFAYRITLNYGTGTEDSFGNIRKGKIEIYRGRNKDSLEKYRAISFQNFYINDLKLYGSKEKTTKKLDDGKYKLTVSFATIINDTIAHSGLREKLLIEGYDTKSRLDDKFQINGKDTLVVVRDQEEFIKTRELKNLIKFSTYRHYVSGEIITTKTEEVISINFGDGTIDNKAIVTKNGESKEIILGRKQKIKTKK